MDKIEADVKHNNNLTGCDPGFKNSSFGRCIGFLLNSFLSTHGQNDCGLIHTGAKKSENNNLGNEFAEHFRTVLLPVYRIDALTVPYYENCVLNMCNVQQFQYHNSQIVNCYFGTMYK